MNASTSSAEAPALRRSDPQWREQTAQFGMWVFLATEVLFFGGALFAYVIGRIHWPDGYAAAALHTNVLIGTINTGVLLTSSLAMALAVTAAEMNQRRWIAPMLWTTVALGALFMVFKGIEYYIDWKEQLIPGANFHLGAEATGTPPTGAALFFVLYWFLTVLHSVHLVIGLGITSTFAWGAGHGRDWVKPPRVQTLGLYWHFVDIVWIFLYPLIYLVERHA
jgi:cytochrome c oxidase subunit 3